jgi:hypothetical protein
MANGPEVQGWGGEGAGAWTADVLPTGLRLNISILSCFLLTFFFVAATGKKSITIFSSPKKIL